MRTLRSRGRRSRNKVSVGEPADGSLHPAAAPWDCCLPTGAPPPTSPLLVGGGARVLGPQEVPEARCRAMDVVNP
jgi:hypothetical protein